MEAKQVEPWRPDQAVRGSTSLCDIALSSFLLVAPDARPRACLTRWQIVRSRDARVSSTTEYMGTHTMGQHIDVLRPHIL